MILSLMYVKEVIADRPARLDVYSDRLTLLELESNKKKVFGVSEWNTTL